MDRLACISLPALPLQIALKNSSGDPKAPLAVVKEDRPASPILHLNRAAQDQGLHPGMRYSEALSIVCDLKAVTVSSQELAQARREVWEALGRWSPHVELCPLDPQSFWVSTSGLETLYGTEAQWGTSVRRALACRRWRAVIVVGSTRMGTYLLARSRKDSTVIRSFEAEQRAMARAPLSVLPLTARHRRWLDQLGITSLAGVLTLPPGEVARRFGPGWARELREGEAMATLPLQPTVVPENLVRGVKLEFTLTDRQALLQALDAPLRNGLDELVRRGRLLAELKVSFLLESREQIIEVLRPAEPTTQAKTILRLLDLRLARLEVAQGVIEIRLSFDAVNLPPGSGELFVTSTTRDLRLGAEAIAVLRARWGNDAVVRPVLVDSHIPEQSFRWDPVERLEVPSPSVRGDREGYAVRRISLVPNPRQANPAGERLGRACRLRVSSPVIDREYWFLRNRRNEVAWVSMDHLTNRPRWEGMVD